MKFIFSIILSTYLYAGLIDNSMNVNYIPISARSSAMGGIYVPLYTNEKEIGGPSLQSIGWNLRYRDQYY